MGGGPQINSIHPPDLEPGCAELCEVASTIPALWEVRSLNRKEYMYQYRVVSGCVFLGLSILG